MKISREIQFPLSEKKYVIKQIVSGNGKITGVPVEGDGVAGFVISLLPNYPAYVKFQFEDVELTYKIKTLGTVIFDKEYFWQYRGVYTIETNFTDCIDMIYIYLP